MGKFEIYCQNALSWLKEQPNHSLGNVITGIPDMEETPFTLDKYLNFVKVVAILIFKKVKKDGYCMFMNTDRKHSGQWYDKSYLIQSAAEQSNIPLKWHKIILLRPPESTHIQRPTYQHYLCFSYEGGPGEATPDVIHCGQRAYKNASCPIPTKHAIDFIKKYSSNKQVVDPFVGRGTVLKIAQEKGLSGIGVDLDKAQCKRTRDLLDKM